MADLSISSFTNPDTIGIHEDVGQNLIANGNFENAPISITAPTSAASVWIDGTAAGSATIASPSGLYWGTPSLGATAQAGWDSTTQNSGTYSMKLSTTNVTGTIVVSQYKGTAISPFLTPLYPSTSYTFSVWIKTNGVATNSAFAAFRQYTSSLSQISTTNSTKFSGTNNWTQSVTTLTTGSTAAYGTVLLELAVAGNISDAWFDDITLTYTPPGGQVSADLNPVVTADIQNIPGPKIYPS